MAELKPCPFCGGKAELVTSQAFEWCDRYYYVRCASEECEKRTHLYDRTHEAIEAWNRRAEDGK